ncbi:MAG: nitrous oxide-stimulated promoter family protein [Chloroflexi bacterium]|nr:nitrous oxide-stimulated promoter family protein [Chloroflexota bacterium]
MDLARYDFMRLDIAKCPFQEGKTTCANCALHCYKHNMRERIRIVMRYTSPRMLYQHPILAVLYLLDSAQNPFGVLHFARNSKGGVLSLSQKAVSWEIAKEAGPAGAYNQLNQFDKYTKLGHTMKVIGF